MGRTYVVESNKTVHPRTPLKRLQEGGLVRIYGRTGLLSFTFPRQYRVSELHLDCARRKGPARFKIFADANLHPIAEGNLEPSDKAIIVFPETECTTLHLFWGDSHATNSIFLKKVEIN